MKRIATSLIALGLLAAPAAFSHGGGAALLAKQQGETPEITSQDLGNGIYMMVGSGGNIGVSAGADGVFVIDSQFLNIAPANLAKIKEIAGGAPTFLVNTHWHGDHTGGNAAFGGTIVAHDNVRGRMSTDQELTRLGQTSTTPASPKEAWPVITFAEGLSLHLNGQTISVFHTPLAHTDGDAMVYFEEADVLHMGDVFFKGNYPFIDTGSGGTVDGYIAAMQTAHDRISEATKVIPGHGPLAARSDIAESIEMLKGVRGAVVAAIEGGMNMEEAVKEDILAEWNEKWGNGFIQPQAMIALAWSDLEPKIAARSQGRGS